MFPPACLRVAPVLLGFLLAACGDACPVPWIGAQQRLVVGAGHDATVSFPAPTAGILQVTLEEHGITTVASLDGKGSTTAGSPLDRMGLIVLAAPTRRGQIHSIWVHAVDAPQVSGSVTLSAQVIPQACKGLAQAADDFAAAGQATHRKDWASAFGRYLHAARDFDHLGLSRQAASARQALAELAYRRFDRKRDAYALAGEALDDYGVATDPALRGLLAGLQAKALMDMPGVSLRSFLPAIRAALAAARRLIKASYSGARELPRLDIMDGFLAFRLDQHSRARQSFVRAAQICRELKDWECYAIAMQNIAELAKEDRSYALALATFEQALQVLPPELYPKVTADIWNNLGLLQEELGLVSSSERSHTAALRAYLQLSDCQGVRRSLSRMGSLMVQVGTLADAETDLIESASLRCPRLLAAARRTATEHTLAQPPPARDSTDSQDSPGPCADPLEADTLTTENKNIVFNSLLALDEALMLQSQVAQAAPCLAAAARYATTSRTRMRLANARGNMRLERGDAAGARAAFTRALQIADQARLPANYEHRGLAELGLVRAKLLAGERSAALTEARQALESSLARGDIGQTVTALRLIAAAERASADLVQAQRTLEVGADLIEAVPIDGLDGEQRATYLSTQHAVFAELMDILASKATSDPRVAWDAFESSERGRSRSLRFASTEASGDTSRVDLARYQRLLHEIVALPHDAHRSPDQLLALLDRAALRERDPPEALTRAQLAHRLQQLDATLVEYAVGNRDMFAFIVSPQATLVMRLGPAREVAAAAANLLDDARDPDAAADDIRAAASALAQRILWPLAAHLRTRLVIFVPDDALHTIPFTVLPWSPGPGPMLVQQVESVIVPSATFLTLPAPAPEHIAHPRLELIGDPVFRVGDWTRECGAHEGIPHAAHATRTLAQWTQSLPSLPGSRDEIAAIARLARQSRPDSHIETLLGCAAVPDALRQAASEDVQLLHIATHARIDAQRPRLSALALSPEPGSPDPVSTFSLLDILGLKLHAQLVVLSACDTSRGRLLPGEGVLGPAQAFLEAGARSVIATYWRVDDQLTVTFMKRFYTHLLIERMDASAALRKTQLDIAHVSASSDWAAFALYGWPDARL